MENGILKTVERLFGPSDVKFKNDFSNRAYEELLADLNILGKTIFSQLIENRSPLEVVAIALDFVSKRIEAKQNLVRSCLEMDLIIQNSNRPMMMIDNDGDVDA